PDLRTSGMWRACAQAHGEVLQHQVLLHRSRASRAFAQPGTPYVSATDSDVAPAALRFSAQGVRSRGATERAVPGPRGRPFRHVSPHRLTRRNPGLESVTRRTA